MTSVVRTSQALNSGEVRPQERRIFSNGSQNASAPVANDDAVVARFSMREGRDEFADMLSLASSVGERIVRRGGEAIELQAPSATAESSQRTEALLSA
jgi:hypothetical protein